MKEQSIAKIYAKSFIELGKANNVNVAQELTNLTEVINTSNDLENVLFLDVFTMDEKVSVFNAIAEKIKLSEIIKSAVKYLIEEKRVGILPLIFKEVIVIDDDEKGFLRGVIEGSSDELSEDHKAKLMAAMSKHIGSKEAKFEYKKNDKLTAGYKVTVDDLQIDASVDNQLKHFKSSVLG